MKRLILVGVAFIATPLWIVSFGDTKSTLDSISGPILGNAASSEGGAKGARPALTSPNIIFFLADDLGYGDLRCFNAETDITAPVLDGLARNGVRFTDHYATATLCSASRRALLTGRWQSRLGEWAEPYGGTPNNDGIPADREPTVAMFLKQAGYATGCFGKWNIGGIDGVSRPGAHGFDTYLCVDHNTDYFYHRKYSHQTHLFDDGIGLYGPGGKTANLGGKYLPDVFGDAAIEFIEENKDGPFFIYLPWCVPHTPMQGPDDCLDTRENPPGKIIEGQHNRETFVEMVEYMDAKTGQILEVLHKYGLDDNTLILFASDNGGQVLGNCAPLRGHKHTLFEGGVRVPLIAYWPDGIKRSRVVEQPTIMMDVTATILDAAGAIATRELDGKSLLPWFDGRGKPEDRLFGWRQRIIDYGNQRNYLRAEACRFGNLKYVKETQPQAGNPVDFPFTEYLFDLSSDLGEQNNLAETNPEQLELMRRKSAEWRTESVNVDTPVFVNPFPDQYGSPTPEKIKTINTQYQKERVAPVSLKLEHRYRFESNASDSVGKKNGKPTPDAAPSEVPRFMADIPPGAVAGAPARSMEVGMSKGTRSSGITLPGGTLPSDSGSASLWLKPHTLDKGDYIVKVRDLKLLCEGNGALKVGHHGYTGLGSATVLPGDWIHVVLTWDASESLISYYVNGTMVASKRVDQPVQSPPLLVGNHGFADAANQYDGLLYDLQFYSGVLDALEVAELHKNPGSVATP
ncbi:sulfatase-like hydrolase/transferase [Pontiella sulfatireligans]|uniref:sulfatase-like hydrolase/transferase n=1 Tax=Pontiella sulfatireligans TaxID=2750658 RepID=UPI00109D0497|nr:sulfatase-like hydrolase/transferase [Pontiella sulfatireligans]